MTTASETEWTFDGNSSLYNTADVLLEFDNGSTLKAHSFILCAASPVLATAVKDCENGNKIRLPAVSREVWIDILRELYPVKSVILKKAAFEEGSDAVMSVGQECRKYGIQSVLDSIDEIIVCLMIALPEQHGEPWDNRMNTYAKVAISLGLQNGIDGIGDYILNGMLMCEILGSDWRRNHSSGEPLDLYPQDMVQVMKDLLHACDAAWIKKFYLETLRCVFDRDV